jgi:hypothetical protein
VEGEKNIGEDVRICGYYVHVCMYGIHGMYEERIEVIDLIF